MTKYKKGCIFGDFDRFHAGHKAALVEILAQCDEVVVVLTKSTSKSPSGKTWGVEKEVQRRQKLTKYVKSLGAESRVSYLVYNTLAEAVADGHNLELDAIINPRKDVGPCLTDNYAIVEANCINAGVTPPTLIWVDTVMEEDGSKTLSSSRIRKREKYKNEQGKDE